MTSSQSPSSEAEPTTDGPTTSAVPDSVASYLDGANGYDGTVRDARGEASVTVRVGTGDGLAFDPAAVSVDPGTRVRRRWVGGAHNVVEEGALREQGTVGEGGPEPESGALYFGPPVSSEGVNYEYTFQSVGVRRYRCQPHARQGMRGVVIVGEA